MSEAVRSWPRIGVVGNDVPRQLVLACGLVPVRLTGQWSTGEPRRSSDLGAVDDAVAGIYDDLRDGVHADLDAVVVCNDSQANLRLFYLLRARGLGGRVHLVDLPRQDAPETRVFAHAQYRSLVEFCAGVSGIHPTASSWLEAAAAVRRVQTAAERMRQRRVQGDCSGTEALAGYRDATGLPPEQAVASIDARRGGCEAGRVRVHVTGSAHPDDTVYRILQEQGVEIVSDDHDTGDRTLLGPAVTAEGVHAGVPEGAAEGDDDLLDHRVDALLDPIATAHFGRTATSAVELAQARARLTAELASSAGAAAVLGIVRDADEAPLWDLADQREHLRQVGIPFHVVTHLRPDTLVDGIHRLARAAVEGEAP